ncbi:MAG: DUF2062 domain-containing protein [Peptococcaceae bacterium]|nr:DUF2062 domain-containing protein [Candidatus Syntrophopropionicum ammoniitolerans]
MVIAESIIYFRKRIVTPVIDSIKAYYTRVMSLPDSPKKVAQGVALGFAFDFLPIPIISIPLSYLVARLARCNAVAAVCTVIFFKLAVPFFYAINLFVGKAIFGGLPGPEIELSGGPLMTNFLEQLAEHGYPFLLGSLLNAVLAWIIVYTLLMYIIRHKRRRDA